MRRLKYCDVIYVEALSSAARHDFVLRAEERIKDLKKSGKNVIQGTLQRLAATTNPAKVMGIYVVAKRFKFKPVMQAAASKYKEMTGRDASRDAKDYE